jgi:membrane dipeptidase
MLIVDAHLDLSWNALQWARDLRRSAYVTRTREAALTTAGRTQNTVCLPEMRKGRVFLSFATTLARCTGTVSDGVDYWSPAQAHAAAMGQIAYYHALEAEGLVRVIGDLDSLNRHVDEWQRWETVAPHTNLLSEGEREPPHGFIISMESADPILAPEHVEQWHAAGVRAIGPAHYGPGRYAGGTGTELGFNEKGVQLLREMERLNIVLDVTHLSDQAFWQALDVYTKPVWASHQNCRALVPHQRQFTDEQIKAVIARGGVLGAAFDIWMLIPNYNRGCSTNKDASLNTVVDHIEHVCQLAGNAKHSGIGSDLDGGFGREQSPHDLDTIADLQRLSELLSHRGFDDEDIAAIMHGNWLRLLRAVWEEQ